MLRALAGFVGSRTRHPIYASLCVAAVVLGVLGFIVELTVNMTTLSGFIGVYAVICAVMGVLGYLLVFVGKFVKKFQTPV